MTDPILPLTALVTTRETSERLAAAGFPQRTLRQWFKLGSNAGWGLRTWAPTRTDTAFGPRLLPAPTAAELGALLPAEVQGHALFHMPMLGGQHVAGYMDSENESVPGLRACASTESEARALLFLALHERDLLLPESYGVVPERTQDTEDA